MIVAWAVVVPFMFVAVSVYVVEAVGLTNVDVVLVTVPTPLMLREVAFVTFQESVDDCPAKIAVGLAAKELIVGGEALCVVALAGDDSAEARPSVSYAATAYV